MSEESKWKSQKTIDHPFFDQLTEQQPTQEAAARLIGVTGSSVGKYVREGGPIPIMMELACEAVIKRDQGVKTFMFQAPENSEKIEAILSVANAFGINVAKL